MKQERRLRFCELPDAKPIFLIEGSFNDNKDKMPRPTIRHEDDMLNPDCIKECLDIENFLAGVICRNLPNYRVFIMKTLNNPHTCCFLSAMAAILQYNNTTFPAIENQKVSNDINDINSFTAVNSYWGGWGAEKRGYYDHFIHHFSSI